MGAVPFIGYQAQLFHSPNVSGEMLKRRHAILYSALREVKSQWKEGKTGRDQSLIPPLPLI